MCALITQLYFTDLWLDSDQRLVFMDYDHITLLDELCSSSKPLLAYFTSTDWLLMSMWIPYYECILDNLCSCHLMQSSTYYTGIVNYILKHLWIRANDQTNRNKPRWMATWYLIMLDSANGFIWLPLIPTDKRVQGTWSAISMWALPRVDLQMLCTDRFDELTLQFDKLLFAHPPFAWSVIACNMEIRFHWTSHQDALSICYTIYTAHHFVCIECKPLMKDWSDLLYLILNFIFLAIRVVKTCHKHVLQ